MGRGSTSPRDGRLRIYRPTHLREEPLDGDLVLVTDWRGPLPDPGQLVQPVRGRPPRRRVVDLLILEDVIVVDLGVYFADDETDPLSFSQLEGLGFCAKQGPLEAAELRDTFSRRRNRMHLRAVR